MSSSEAWAALPAPWQACIDEAWLSWRAGSAGVGCVVTDGAGEIVARGRNRRLDPKVVPHELAGTPIAHAETVALATLPDGDYRHHTLYTSFEPCLMCASTTLVMGIGRVAYAAADPLFDGMHDWFGELEWAATRRPEREVLGGRIGSFAHVLHLSWLAFWLSPDAPVMEAHRRVSPRELELATAIATEGHLDAIAREGGGVEDALAAVWHTLP